MLGIGVTVVIWWRPGVRTPKVSGDDDLDPVLTVANPGYVGVKACAECHGKRVAEFQETRHFVACTPSSGVRAPGFVPGRDIHPTRDPGLHFEMKCSHDEFVVSGLQMTPQGPRRLDYPIGLVYGAGGAGDEMYFAWQGDRLYNLSVAWLYPFQRWGHAVDSIDARQAFPNCLECHNTWIGHIPGTPNQYRKDDMILGVGCERCHGPAAEHVAHHRQHPKGTAHAILHPGTLTRDQLMDVCNQCHSNVKPKGPAFAYRPGEPLDAHYRTIQTKYPEDEQVANQVRYLRQSKCFQKSEMTCITCHDPHRPHQAAATQRACLQCHKATACPDQPRLPAAVRGDCVGCHMPPRVWMNVRFHTSDDQYVPVAPRSDHRIAVHPEGKQAVLLAWLRTQKDDKSRGEAKRVADQLAKHWLDEAENRRGAARLVGTIGALREALKADASPPMRQRLQDSIARLTEFDRLVTAGNALGQADPDETISMMKKILAIKPDHAQSRGDLGAAYLVKGDHAEAEAQLRAGVEHDAEDSYCLTTLAALASQEGRWEDAAGLYAQAEKIEPRHADIHFRWGLALLKLERWTEAEVRFRRALSINPRHAGGSQGLSEALLRLRYLEEALLHARRAVHWTGARNAEMLITLADAYAAHNRPADVEQTLEQALIVAQGTQPALVPRLQARLRELPQARK